MASHDQITSQTQLEEGEVYFGFQSLEEMGRGHSGESTISSSESLYKDFSLW